MEGDANKRFSTGTFRGVVVTQTCGLSPSRNANCNWSQVSCAFFHLASSSTQAASNWGPRKPSGSCAVCTVATAPFGQTSRLRPASHSGRRSSGEQARMPLSPKIITSRTCSMVSPTSATRRQRPASIYRAPPPGRGPIPPPPASCPHPGPQHHPGPPRALRRQLMVHRPELEEKGQRQHFLRRQGVKKPLLEARIGAGDPACTRFQPGLCPDRGRGALGRYRLACFCFH